MVIHCILEADIWEFIKLHIMSRASLIDLRFPLGKAKSLQYTLNRPFNLVHITFLGIAKILYSKEKAFYCSLSIQFNHKLGKEILLN